MNYHTRIKGFPNLQNFILVFSLCSYYEIFQISEEREDCQVFNENFLNIHNFRS